jgi:hypothetical protein
MDPEVTERTQGALEEQSGLGQRDRGETERAQTLRNYGD